VAAARANAEGWQLLSRSTAESFRLALAKSEEAMPLWRAIGDRDGEAHALHTAGSAYDGLGEKSHARESHAQALLLWRTLGDRLGEAYALHSLGNVTRQMGEMQEAFEYFNQALPILRATGERRGESTTLLSIGTLYNDLGDKQKALEYFNLALEIRRVVGSNAGQALALTNIGGVYEALGDPQSALDYYTQALHLPGFDLRGKTNTLTRIGSSHVARGDLQNARDAYDEALSLSRRTGDLRWQAIALNGIAGIHDRLGDKSRALELLEQVLSMTRTTRDRGREAAVLSAIARIERDRGDLLEARVHGEAAVTIIDSLRTRVASQELRASYFASVQQLYELYIDVLMRLHTQHPSQGFDATAWQVSERSRVRTLLELLTEARADIRQGVDQALLERARAIEHRLNSAAERQMRLRGGPHTKEQAAAATKELEELTTELQHVEGQIRVTSPRYAALEQPQPLSLREVQEDVLDADTLLLEYALGDERSYLWALTPTAITSYELPNRAVIETAARRVYSLMTARQTGPRHSLVEHRARVAEADTRYWVEAAALSHMLLGPVQSELGTKRLLIVGDGALQYMPLAALPKPLTPGTPLMVDHEVVSLPSASVLALLRRQLEGRKLAPKAVAVLADPVFDVEDERLELGVRRKTTGASKPSPDLTVERAARDVGALDAGGRLTRLPSTRREAEAILAVTPAGEGMKALDFHASRAAATSHALTEYRIVHFATHGFLSSAHPALSGIALSLVDERGAPQQGFLRLHDLYNLSLPAELVVLSACQTALGKEIKGEGLVGLTRGFMYAGAPRVIASLWQVDDVATAELMRRLYHGMLGPQHLSPAAALRAAQMAMWRKKQWQAPYYWAAFVMQGEWRGWEAPRPPGS